MTVRLFRFHRGTLEDSLIKNCRRNIKQKAY